MNDGIELARLLNEHGVESGTLVPATKDIYYNSNLTDHEHVFIKITRHVDDYYWFSREITEAATAHELLIDRIPTPRPLLLEPLALSDGRHASVWEYIEHPAVKDTVQVKTEKLLNAATTIASLTEKRIEPQYMTLSTESWKNTVNRAFERLQEYPDPELEHNILTAQEYIENAALNPVWIHGDLHGANAVDGTDYIVDWDCSQLGFIEWDLAHIVKEPFHYIDHAEWDQGETNFYELLDRIKERVPGVDTELIRQCAILRRSAAIQWKRSMSETKLDRWFRTLRWLTETKF